MSRTIHRVASLTALSLGALACGSDTSSTGLVPWNDQRTQVVSADRAFTEVAPAAGDACINFASECLKPAAKCGKEAADIVLDGQGKLVDYLCYPAASTWTVADLQAQHGAIAQKSSNTVLVLDTLDDGADIAGDVAVDANNVVLYGSSPRTAVLAGSLAIDGNNALIRGLRIQGDVTISKNDATLAFCVIEGNLTIAGNNTKLLACDVLGSITITGNNTQLYANHVASGPSTSGKNTDCKDNVLATDTNVNHSFEPSELGTALVCK